LSSITNRMAINRVLRRRPIPSAEPSALEAAYVETNTPLSLAIDREATKELLAGLNRLGDLDRSTLEAFYVRGRSLIEMSDDFRSPVGTIKRRLHVARNRLKKQLERVAG
jgi:RNA polymerase sigma-70 factor (ECF subfamily)